MTTRAWLRRLRDRFWYLGAEGFPWHLPDRRSSQAAQKLRRLGRRLVWKTWPRPIRPLAGLAAIFLWPIRSRTEARRLILASNAEALLKKPVWRLWHVALRHNAAPAECAAFGVHQMSVSGVDQWLFTREASLVSGHLMSRSVSDLCGDKVRLAEFCLENGRLPVASSLAVFSSGTTLKPFDAGMPPSTDLVAKPIRAAQGRGCVLWRYTDGGYATGDMRAAVCPKELAETLRVRSASNQGTLIVQKLIPAHTALSRLVENGPPVARIVTGRWPGGTVEVIEAMLQKPRAGQWMTHSGPFRLIDPDTGCLVPRKPRPHIFPDLTDDPVFDDLAIPDWQACQDGLMSLHRQIPDQAPLIGWDIVSSPEGPVILEANTTLAPYFFQLARQAPAGDGRWCALLSSYLA
ncbi:MAG: sugar-transfer associated ATP-grasp domain-containing protein [Pseudomonadota bacterium]